MFRVGGAGGNEQLEQIFLEEATKKGLLSLKGHRWVQRDDEEVVVNSLSGHKILSLNLSIFLMYVHTNFMVRRWLAVYDSITSQQSSYTSISAVFSPQVIYTFQSRPNPTNSAYRFLEEGKEGEKENLIGINIISLFSSTRVVRSS